MSTENPYVAPQVETAIEPVVDDGVRPGRPIGVAILAVLHLLGGVGMVVVVILMSQWAWFPARSVLVFALGVAAATAVRSIVTGVGPWGGARWGWWLAGFYQCLSLLQYSLASGFGVLEVLVMGPPTVSIGPDLAFSAGQAVVHGLLLWYLFRTNVMAYCAVSHWHRGKALGVLAGVALTFMAVLATWAAVMAVGL